MLHKFPIPEFPNNEKSIQQECLNCGVRSIVYQPRVRFYYNSTGKMVTNAPKCLKARLLHSFPAIEIPEGVKEIIQTCTVCGKKRVVYASRNQAFFDEATGARIPYSTACTSINNAKVISINEFVKDSQIEEGDISLKQKFFEAIFILSSIQRFGVNERTTMMLGSFLDGQHDELITLSKAL